MFSSLPFSSLLKTVPCGFPQSWSLSMANHVTHRLKSSRVMDDDALVQVCYQGRNVVTRTFGDLLTLENAVRRLFEIPQETSLVLFAEILEFDNWKIKIDRDVWPSLQPKAQVIWVDSIVAPRSNDPTRSSLPQSFSGLLPVHNGDHRMLSLPILPKEEDSSDCVPKKINAESASSIPLQGEHPLQSASIGNKALPRTTGEKFLLHVDTCEGPLTTLNVSRNTRIASILNKLSVLLGKDVKDLRPLWEGQLLHNLGRLQDYNISPEDSIYIGFSQTGGKPVIYLTSQVPVDVDVVLELVSGWSFSALYPVVPVKKHTDGRQEVAWKVHVRPDGTIQDQASGSDVSYLYWEAKTNPSLPRLYSPPSSRPTTPAFEQSQTVEVFDPSRPNIIASNSIVLSISQVPKYLDKALLALGLHTEARTSFITYWLPSLLEHPHIALRFLPQISYERAAPLTVTPRPSSVTRIFMLWRGLKSYQVEEDDWASACQRAVSMQVEDWRVTVGVDDEHSSLDGLRVLEWGGMEVKM